MSGYSNEYQEHLRSPEWKEHRQLCHKFTQNHCVLFPFLKSKEVHHMHYKNMKNELIIRDTVPLSKTAHSIVHKFFWTKKKYSFKRKAMANFLRFAFVINIIYWQGIYRFFQLMMLLIRLLFHALKWSAKTPKKYKVIKVRGKKVTSFYNK